MLRALLFLSVTALAAAAGIYPDGHFDHSTKLTVSNFDEVMKETVSSTGVTVVYYYV
jgi:hypothetical protein